MLLPVASMIVHILWTEVIFSIFVWCSTKCLHLCIPWKCCPLPHTPLSSSLSYLPSYFLPFSSLFSLIPFHLSSSCFSFSFSLHLHALTMPLPKLKLSVQLVCRRAGPITPSHPETRTLSKMKPFSRYVLFCPLLLFCLLFFSLFYICLAFYKRITLFLGKPKKPL